MAVLGEFPVDDDELVSSLAGCSPWFVREEDAVPSMSATAGSIRPADKARA
jgi:hypothetical protein